jgi:hypothetical protein
MGLAKIVREQVDDNALASAFALVGAVATGLALAVWSAVEGWDGPSIALAALAAATFVVVIAVAVAVAHHYGYLERKLVQYVLRTIGAVAFFLLAQWFVGLLGELRTLRAEANKSDTRPFENPDHAEQLRELGGLKETNRLLEKDRDKAQAAQETAVQRLNVSEQRIRDLERQLDERARRRQAVEALSPFLATGRKLQAQVKSAFSGAPTADPLQAQIETWIRETRAAIRTNVDSVTADQLTSESGLNLPPLTTAFTGVPNHRINWWYLMETCLIRLERAIERITP